MLDSYKSNSLLLGLILLALLLLVYSCSKKQSDIVSQSPSPTQALVTAQELLGANSEVIPNQDSTLFLCLLSRKPMTTYAVVNINGDIALDQQKVRGKVSWHTPSSIKVQEQPGVIEDRNSKPSDYAKIIEINQNH